VGVGIGICKKGLNMRFCKLAFRVVLLVLLPAFHALGVEPGDAEPVGTEQQLSDLVKVKPNEQTDSESQSPAVEGTDTNDSKNNEPSEKKSEEEAADKPIFSANDEFKPSEQVSEDLSIPFPIDI